MNFMIAALIFFWGIGSLFLVATKTKSTRTVFIKPSIMIGDFLLLPLIGGLIGASYRTKSLEMDFVTFSILFISFALAIISALRNKLTHPQWIPHLLFYWFMAFIVLLFLSTFEFSSSWWLVLIGIITHQSLRILYPKKFPKINHPRHSGANEVSDRI